MGHPAFPAGFPPWLLQERGARDGAFRLLRFEEGDGLFDDGGKLFEVVDEGDEVGVDLRVGGEVEAVGGEGALGRCDEGLDVGYDGGEAGDEGLLERLLRLEDLLDAGGEADGGFDGAGEPFAEVRDFDAHFLEDIHPFSFARAGMRADAERPARISQAGRGSALPRARSGPVFAFYPSIIRIPRLSRFTANLVGVEVLRMEGDALS